MSRDVSERLAAARAAVDRACHLLLSPAPGQIDRCSRLLEPLVPELTACHSVVRPVIKDDQILTQATGLLDSLGRARRLLAAASAFHENWLRRLGEISAGYTGQGEPASPSRSPRIQMEV
jgi:hypothetical protein